MAYDSDPKHVTEASSLGAKQRLFSRLLGTLLTQVYAFGYELSMADGNVDPLRKGHPTNDPQAKTEPYTDAVHMSGSLHYMRLAQDLNLFVDGKFVTDGGHPAWAQIGVWWEGQHPLCRWGGRFRDANHFSVTHGGKS